ncbi:histone-lysine N-methyltransferase SETMAR [Trichonephila clavipes]|nr:histone-lysine N-methyltransferase SETMAR [Trichonephila clavipes]
MACDAEDCGFQMLKDDEIVTSEQEESNPVNDETDEDEDNNNNESNKGPSKADAFSALETDMEWYEQQLECCPTQLLLLKRIRDLAATNERCISDVKDATRTGSPFVENVDKITEIIEVDRYVSIPSIAQELKINHKKVLSHLSKVGFKKKPDVWVPHQLTPENMMDQISICEALTKRNEIETFLKRMVTGDKKWVTYGNIVRKRSWSKRGEAAQTVAEPGLTSRKVLQCIWWDWKGIIYYELLP